METHDWLAQQIINFFAALAAGLLAGVFYEVYKRWLARSPRRRYRKHCWKTDGLFGLFLIIFFSAWWFLLTDGSLRAAVFVWIACGWLLAHLSLDNSHK